VTAAERLKQVERLLEELGVGTYFLIMRDPDSDLILRAKEGSSIWLLGANRLVDECLIDEWRPAKKPTN